MRQQSRQRTPLARRSPPRLHTSSRIESGRWLGRSDAANVDTLRVFGHGDPHAPQHRGRAGGQNRRHRRHRPQGSKRPGRSRSRLLDAVVSAVRARRDGQQRTAPQLVLVHGLSLLSGEDVSFASGARLYFVSGRRRLARRTPPGIGDRAAACRAWSRSRCRIRWRGRRAGSCTCGGPR